MARARSGDLCLGFVQVHVYVRADFVGQRLYPFQRCQFHRVAGVWAESDLDQLLIAILIVQLHPAVYALVDIAQSGAGRVHHGDRQLQAESRPYRRIGGDLRVPVVVAGAGCAGSDHFRQRQSRAVRDEVAINHAFLEGPHDLVEPRIERLRPRHAAHERHRQMAVGIHQPRHQHMRVEIDRLGVGKAGAEFLERFNRRDAAVFDGDARLFPHDVVRCDGQEIARFQNGRRHANKHTQDATVRERRKRATGTSTSHEKGAR